MMEHADKYIIDGFRSFNPAITKEYFYGYCRRAYNIYDYKYQLRNKTGLDFYSLAHEYYIHLLKFKFKPLLDKPKEMKLSTWMAKGFHFVVLDALKAYNKEFEHKAEEAADVVLEYVRSTDKEEGMLSYVAEAVAAHYHDRIMHEIAFMIFRAGFKQKEVAAQLGMTPAAVNQRYKKMMEEVVTPFVIENYGSGLYTGTVELCKKNGQGDSTRHILLCSQVRGDRTFYYGKKSILYGQQAYYSFFYIFPQIKRDICFRFKPSRYSRRWCSTNGSHELRCCHG